jgi:formamidopyrimidine-DNA glycosylase
MPEGPEIRLMSDFINEKSHNKKIVNVIKHKTKVNTDLSILENKTVSLKTEYHGKELRLILSDIDKHLYFNMGMSGFWSFSKDQNIDDYKWVKLQFVYEDGSSLLMQDMRCFAKWKWDSNWSTNRSPDPIQDFDKWKDNILNNLHKSDFKKPVYEWLLNQKWNNSVGNYLRSTILFYMDLNPFQSAAEYISNSGDIFFEVIKDIMETSYALGGGQLMDWKNPFNLDAQDFKSWVFYQKGLGIKDSGDRTFWFHPKWEQFTHSEILYRK